MPDNTRALLRKIEAAYGRYPCDESGKSELRGDVGRFLLRRYDDNAETLATVLEAIKESCAIRFGPPDVATIRLAIAAYEGEYGIRIRPPAEGSSRPDPAEVIKARGETLVDMRIEAQALGIDTSADGWVATYCFALMARERHEAAE